MYHQLHNLYECIFQHVSRKIRFPEALHFELIPDTNVVLVIQKYITRKKSILCYFCQLRLRSEPDLSY